MMSPWVLDELNRAHQEELRRAGRPSPTAALLPALRHLVASRRHRPSPSAPALDRVVRRLYVPVHPWPGAPDRRAASRPAGTRPA